MNSVSRQSFGCVLLVKVHSYVKKNIEGILYDVSNNIRYRYSNISQLISTIENILNASDMKIVTRNEIFESARHEGRYELMESSKPWLFSKKRAEATFKLNICFRRFGTWQGMVSCMDSGNSNAFRNVMEMILMMDNELQTTTASLEETANGVK